MFSRVYGIELPQPERVQALSDFMVKRHKAYLKYKVLGYPKSKLTDDPIIQKYKFTNVYRELDTGTIWLRENVRHPYAYHEELFFNIALYRIYNRIATAEALGFIEDYPTSGAEKIVREMYDAGESVFTGAYMLTGTLGGDKIHQVFNLGANYLWDHRRKLEPRPRDTLRDAFNRINDDNVPGIGPFISYEIVSDLRWTRYLNDASDIMTWANPGPGCKRGIMRVYNLPVNHDGMSREQRAEIRASFPSNYDGMVTVMRYLLKEIQEQKRLPNLEMREIEHCLCEFDKYERVRLGEGRPRSIFNTS